jgi:hypothetical protein
VFYAIDLSAVTKPCSSTNDSPANMFDYTTGDLHFSSETALQQHLHDSTNVIDLLIVKRLLQQHLWDSPVRAPSFDCETTDGSFSNEALGKHLHDSRIHQQDTETPLDVLFCSFLMLGYDTSLPPATSYANLREHEGWRRDDVASDDAWNRYQDVLENELHIWYGGENNWLHVMRFVAQLMLSRF